jgi:hypothetical protein
MTRAPDTTRIRQQCQEADPSSTIEYYVVCAVCGQIYDCRDENAVIHHSTGEHVARFPSERGAQLKND